MVGKEAVDDLFDVVGTAASVAGTDRTETTGSGTVRTDAEGKSAETGAPDEDGDDAVVEIVLRVQVQPGAGRPSVVGRHGDALKVRVAAQPEGDRADDAVAGLLATTLGLPKAAVVLVSGHGDRSKRFRVGPVELGALRRLLLHSDPFKGRRSGSTGSTGGTRGVR